jgi:hypothetical protein
VATRDAQRYGKNDAWSREKGIYYVSSEWLYVNFTYWCYGNITLNAVYLFVVAIAVGGYILWGKLWKWEWLCSLWLLFYILKVYWAWHEYCVVWLCSVLLELKCSLGFEKILFLFDLGDVYTRLIFNVFIYSLIFCSLKYVHWLTPLKVCI